jgi:mono/diheme cytochrome c family protein
MKIIALIALTLFAVATASLDAATAQENWTKDCMQCHGKTGAADTKMGRLLSAKDLTSPQVQASFTDAQATDAIKNGIKENGKTKMKAFGDKLSGDEVKALVAYVRTLKK